MGTTEHAIIVAVVIAAAIMLLIFILSLISSGGRYSGDLSQLSPVIVYYAKVWYEELDGVHLVAHYRSMDDTSNNSFKATAYLYEDGRTVMEINATCQDGICRGFVPDPLVPDGFDVEKITTITICVGTCYTTTNISTEEVPPQKSVYIIGVFTPPESTTATNDGVIGAVAEFISNLSTGVVEHTTSSSTNIQPGSLPNVVSAGHVPATIVVMQDGNADYNSW